MQQAIAHNDAAVHKALATGHNNIAEWEWNVDAAIQIRTQSIINTMLADILHRFRKGDVSRRSGAALFAFVARSLEQISTLVMTFLAAAFLLPAEYGVYALAIVFIVLLQTLTYTGFYQFVVTSTEPDDDVLATSFWLIVGMSTVASILLGLAAYPMEWLFEAEELGTVIVLFALAQPFSSFGAWASAVLLRRGQVNVNFMVMFWQNLVSLICGALLLMVWESLYALVAFRYIRVFMGLALYLAAGARFPGFGFQRTLARKATTFSGGLYGARFLGFLAKYITDILLGLYYSTAEVGLYRFGSRVALSATDMLSQPMTNFAITQMGAAARGSRDFAAPLTRFVGTIALLTGMMGAVVIVFAESAISQFFEAYILAVVVTYAMATRAALGASTLLMESVFAAVAKTSWVMTFNLVVAIVAIIACFAAAPFGLAALAWSQVAVVFLSAFWAFALIHWKAGVAVQGAVRSYLVALGLAVLYGVTLAWLSRQILPLFGLDPLWQLLCGVVMAALLGPLFLLLGWRMRVFTLRVFQG